MRVVVATHGHCFDGLVSAALFTRLLQSVEGRSLEFEYLACGYGASQRHASEAELTGDTNAILDYRLTPSSRVTWAFDHHPTAFQLPGTRELYEAGHARARMFVDSNSSSCAKLIASVARAHFDFHDPALDELVAWADKVDAARFDDPEDAIDQQHPVKRLVTVVEHHANENFITRFVPELLQRPLGELAAQREIRDRYRPLGKKRSRFVRLLRSKCERRGRVLFADLREHQLDSVGKFVGYALHPDCVYSVMVGRQGKGAKVLVGYNPWCGTARDTDLSVICARYGGGGHPFVGAIPLDQEPPARAAQIALEIANELAG